MRSRGSDTSPTEGTDFCAFGSLAIDVNGVYHRNVVTGNWSGVGSANRRGSAIH